MLRGRTLAKVLAVSIIAILTISAVMLSGGSGGDVASRNSLPSEGVGDQTTLSSLISAPGVENVLNSGRPFKLNDLLVAVPTLRQTRVTMDIDAGPALGVEAAESIENQNQDRNDSVDGDPSVPEDHVTIAAATSALLAARLTNLTQASVNPDIVKEARIKETNSSLPSGLIETGVTLRTGVSSSSANRTADPTETDDSMALATAALQKQVAQALAEADIALKTTQANPPQSRRNRKSSSAGDTIRPGSRIKGQNPGNNALQNALRKCLASGRGTRECRGEASAAPRRKAQKKGRGGSGRRIPAKDRAAMVVKVDTEQLVASKAGGAKAARQQAREPQARDNFVSRKAPDKQVTKGKLARQKARENAKAASASSPSLRKQGPSRPGMHPYAPKAIPILPALESPPMESSALAPSPPASLAQTLAPSSRPSLGPSSRPSLAPSHRPSSLPSVSPSFRPSPRPSPRLSEAVSDVPATASGLSSIEAFALRKPAKRKSLLRSPSPLLRPALRPMSRPTPCPTPFIIKSEFDVDPPGGSGLFTHHFSSVPKPTFTPTSRPTSKPTALITRDRIGDMFVKGLQEAEVLAKGVTQGCDVVMYTTVFYAKGIFLADPRRRCKHEWMEGHEDLGRLCCVLVTGRSSAKALLNTYKTTRFRPWRLLVMDVPNFSADTGRYWSRVFKLLSHRLFTTVNVTIFVDWKLELQQDPRLLVNKTIVQQNATFSAWRHPCATMYPVTIKSTCASRESHLPWIFHEVGFLRFLKKSHPEKVGNWTALELQEERYKQLQLEGKLKFEHFLEGGVLIRDSRSKIVRDVNELWWAEYTKEDSSDRDQLSLAFALNTVVKEAREHAAKMAAIMAAQNATLNGTNVTTGVHKLQTQTAPKSTKGKESSSSITTTTTTATKLSKIDEVRRQINIRTAGEELMYKHDKNKELQENNKVDGARKRARAGYQKVITSPAELGMFFIACMPKVAPRKCGNLAHWSLNHEVAIVNQRTVTKSAASIIGSNTARAIGKEQSSVKKKFEQKEVKQREKWREQEEIRYRHIKSNDIPDEFVNNTNGGEFRSVPSSLEPAVYTEEESLPVVQTKRAGTLSGSVFAKVFRDAPRATLIPLSTPTLKPTIEPQILTSAEIVSKKLITQASIYGITLLPAQASALLAVFGKDGGSADEIALIIENLMMARRGNIH